MDKFLKISYQVLEDTCIAPVYVTSIYRNNIQIDVAFFTMLFPWLINNMALTALQCIYSEKAATRNIISANVF